MKKIIIAAATILAIGTLTYAGCVNCNTGENQSTERQIEPRLKTEINQLQRADDPESAWAMYQYSKLPFTFEHPTSWLKTGNESESLDLSGNVNSIEVNFTDTLSQSRLTVTYHLGSKGIEIYKYALSQFKSAQGWYQKDSKQLKVAGCDAVQASNTITKTGKGRSLDTPIKLILVDFIDAKQTGEIQLQFQTPLTEKAKVESGKFSRLLTSFKLIN